MKNDEKAIYNLRVLYEKYGYSQYKMSKFEEYDLYVRNKDFLVSDNIITFTDTNGKLMALKPDVTLSIIKNSKETKNSVEKLYYNENVYRVSKGTDSFKEIMQVGLECMGDIDMYSLYEVLMLAGESLKSISEDFILDISDFDIVSELINDLSIENETELLKCISEKNIHGIDNILSKESVPDDKKELLKKIVLIYGSPKKVSEELSELALNEKIRNTAKNLFDICEHLENCGMEGKIKIDFSIVNDRKYYNGIVFKGYIKGIPASILSGGRYDKLMKKMGKSTGAIGFAVYLDSLEFLDEYDNKYDVDVVLVYDNDDIGLISKYIKKYNEMGMSVSALKKVSGKMKYKKLIKITKEGEEILENNA